MKEIMLKTKYLLYEISAFFFFINIATSKRMKAYVSVYTYKEGLKKQKQNGIKQNQKKNFS